MSVNKVILLGNVTRTPEMRYTPSGVAICQIGIALNRQWWDKATGEKREEVTFVDVEVFGKSAEAAHQYLDKGRQVYIEGRLKLDTWQDKQTQQKRYKLKVICERLQFIGNKGNGGGDRQSAPAQAGPARAQAPRPAQAARPAPAQPPPEPEQPDFSPGASDGFREEVDGDDEIPF